MLVHASKSIKGGSLQWRTVSQAASKWARCEELGYYRTSKCNTLIAPGTKCSEEHFHRPNWATSPTLTDDDGAPVEVCITCQDRGIQPSRSRDADDSYNHSNRGR
jgi:hypothetical protein